MKAVRVHQVGGPEALVYEEVADPRAGPGQAVVRIEAAGLNFIDVYHRTGFYKLPTPPPFTLGQEGAGTVTAVGDGVSEPAVGDRFDTRDSAALGVRFDPVHQSGHLLGHPGRRLPQRRRR